MAGISRGAGEHYLEIQGGLATTQTEYVRMPAGACWEWLEAYGPFSGDAQLVHGDWPAAIEHVEKTLEHELSRSGLEERLNRWQSDADRAPAEILQTGSGWGALENRRRTSASGSPIASSATPLPDSTLCDEQEPWLRLLDEGALPYREPQQLPGAYMTDSAWRDLLESALAANRGAHWLSWLHVGIMRYRGGDSHGARQAWLESLQREPSAWAYRNLAALAQDAGEIEKAARFWAIAARMKPDLQPLAVEACDALLAAGAFAAVQELIGQLPSEVANARRVRLLGAIAALRSGDLAAPAEFFAARCEIPNIREGELSLSDLWFEWQEARLANREGVPLDAASRQQVRREHPLPSEFDFRMQPD